jgi:hypothetical protein
MSQAIQSQIDNPLLREADTLSQLLYGKPYAELDEKRQETMRRSARALLREKCSDVQPSVCNGCGKALPFEKIECRRCHDSVDVERTEYAMRRGEL